MTYIASVFEWAETQVKEGQNANLDVNIAANLQSDMSAAEIIAYGSGNGTLAYSPGQEVIKPGSLPQVTQPSFAGPVSFSLGVDNPYGLPNDSPLLIAITLTTQPINLKFNPEKPQPEWIAAFYTVAISPPHGERFVLAGTFESGGIATGEVPNGILNGLLGVPTSVAEHWNKEFVLAPVTLGLRPEG